MLARDSVQRGIDVREMVCDDVADKRARDFVVCKCGGVASAGRERKARWRERARLKWRTSGWACGLLRSECYLTGTGARQRATGAYVTL